MVGFTVETRPLKKPRLGPPDVYPQDPKQKEDELTATNVKQGYAQISQLNDEFGSAKSYNISAAKIGAYINATISKRTESSTLHDTAKRRAQVNTKDHFWHVTPRLKQTLESWMRDLAGSKPLAALAKKVPIFNKREEIFLTLAEHQVPFVRASWFLKMTASYNTAISEAKTKKRLLPDPSQEWTVSLERCLKDILMRDITGVHNGGSGAAASSFGSSTTPVAGGSNAFSSPQNADSPSGSQNGAYPQTSNPQSCALQMDDGLCLRQWSYCTDLAKHLYEEGLLDRYEWLQWIVEMCDKTKSLEDSAWKNIIPLVLTYLPDISQSELLARRLSTLAAKKLNYSVFSDYEIQYSNGFTECSPPTALVEKMQCPAHRPVILGLVAALQVVTLECPTAMVYNNIFSTMSENARNVVPPGSPMDILPVPPSVLPMPPRANNSYLRSKVRDAEMQIILRSRAVENSWSCDEWQKSCAGLTLRKVLNALDSLDRHSFDKLDGVNSLDTLYAQVFPEPPDKDNEEADAPIVLLLCQWAVGSQRTGEHRALAVARLLEHRQMDYSSNLVESSSTLPGQNSSSGTPNPSSNGEAGSEVKIECMDSTISFNGSDNPETSNGAGNSSSGNASETGTPSSTSGNNHNPNSVQASEIMNEESNNGGGSEDDNESSNYGFPIFHNLLFKFIDSDSHNLAFDEGSPDKIKFSSLVHLFAALIRHDIFSHDAYLRTLVARGDLCNMPVITSNPTSTGGKVNAPGSVTMNQTASTPGGAAGPGSHAGPATPASVSSVTPGTTPHHDSVDDRGSLFQPIPRFTEMTTNKQTDFDDKNDDIDDDLDRILQDITQEQQNNMDQVDSPKDDSVNGAGGGFGSMTPSHHQPPGSCPDPTNPGSVGSIAPNLNNSRKNVSSCGEKLGKQACHRMFVTHFPLPQDDSFQHEANQRQILLYGVGRSRDEAKHLVKKVTKELSKFFSKKFCYDISDSSRVKKSSKNEINLDALNNRFSSLPIYDQHAVTFQMSQCALELMSAFAAGRGNYLPTVEHISLLSELLESCQNITGLLDTCVQMAKEVPEIEAQLNSRCSPIAISYTTSLQLQLVAILRRYHCCLLLDSESLVSIWESFIRYMRRLTSSTETTSADRCTLAYMMELHNSVGFLRAKVFADCLNSSAWKLRQSLCTRVQPAKSSLTLDNQFMTQYLDNPKRKIDNSVIRQLVENPVCRYSFVCNAVLSICNEADTERLNDLASLCADMTAACPTLASEWLGVFQSLCNPSRHIASYTDVLKEVDVKLLDIHFNLATLAAILIARQCFSLQDFVVQAVPSLLKAWNEGRGPNDPDTEAEARLTCHLLLSLFKTQDYPGGINSNGMSQGSTTNSTLPCALRQSCDRRLLSATHNSITLGAVLAVLKAMLLVADAAGSGERRRDQRNLPGMSGELSISHILGTSDVPSERSDGIRGEHRTLASFAFTALQQMCKEPWVRHRCLQNPEETCQSDMLLDPIVSPKQALRLLHLICYPNDYVADENLEARIQIPRILESLNQWNLREAWLALTVQSKQLASNQPDQQNWLDTVARSVLDVFDFPQEDSQELTACSASTPSPAPGKSPRSGKKSQSQDSLMMSKSSPGANGYNNCNSNNSLVSSHNSNCSNPHSVGVSVNGNSVPSTSNFPNDNRYHGLEDDSSENAADSFDNYFIWTTSPSWLVGPLVAKLSSSVQGRVLRHAGNVLENTLWPKVQSKFKQMSIRTIVVPSGSLHSQLPFLALILTCLRGQDEQRESLLASLLNQFNQLLALAKDPNILATSASLRDPLRLRLSLVGGMFDTIQRSSSATADWAVALTQLVTHSVVDTNNNSDVFHTVIDMVSTLVHSTQIAEHGDRAEETKKQSINLIKKLKKELNDRDLPCVRPLRQLLPFAKLQVEVVVTQATSLILDTKGNKVHSFELVDKKQGLKVWEKQKVSPWDLLEGQKNPAPLSWAWFGAVKMERKPLRYEEAFQRLKFHMHNEVKPMSYYLEPVPLPEEDIDVVPEIKEEVITKPDTPMSHTSPRDTNVPLGIAQNSVKKPKPPRKKRQTKAQAAAAAAALSAATNSATVPTPAPIQPQSNIVPSHPPAGNPYTQGASMNQIMPVGPSGPPGPVPGSAPGPIPNQNPNFQPNPTASAGPSASWHQGNQMHSFYPSGSRQPPPQMQSKQALQTMLRARTTTPMGPGPTPAQYQQYPQGAGPAPQRQANILQQQLRGQNPAAAMQQRFQNQNVAPGQNVMFQQQAQAQQSQMPPQGMTANYPFNQSQAAQPSQGPNMMPGAQHQMMNTRGPVPVQDMSYMQNTSQGQMRPMQRAYIQQMNPNGPPIQNTFGPRTMTAPGAPANIQNPQGMMANMQNTQGMQMGPSGMGQMMQNVNQRMRLMNMQLQQQQQQQQQTHTAGTGMGPGNRMHYPNQSGGY